MDKDSYFTVLTKQGAAEFALAAANQEIIQLHELSFGDGNGQSITPYDTMQNLVNEVYRSPISARYTDTKNPNWLVVEARVPIDIGGFTIREIGLVGGREEKKLLAVGNVPARFKPVLENGAASDMLYRMIIDVGNADTVEITIDKSIIFATNEDLMLAIKNHESKKDVHPQYLTHQEGDIRYRNPGRYFFSQF